MTSSVAFSNDLAIKQGSIWRPAGIIIGVEGTTYPGFPGPPSTILNNGTGFWSGFASGLVGGVINSLDGLWNSYLPGYSAKTIPMWPSVQEAREDIVSYLGPQGGPGYSANYLAAYGFYPPTVLTGYSQGSMATDQVWVYDILTPPGSTDPNGKPTGRLHYLLPFVYRSYQFGHIFRSPGIAHGNALIGLPQSIIQDGVETGGIGAGMDLTVAQTNFVAPDGNPVVYSCANKGDLYTCCSVGLNPWTALAPEGKTGNLFEQIIMQPTLADMLKVAEVLETPWQSILELLHTMKFFAAGTNAPHYLYYPQMVGCITDCYQLGLSLPHTV